MQQFDHPHVIKLIGIVSDSPSYIIMELASYGEVCVTFLWKNFSKQQQKTVQLKIKVLITCCIYFS